jgi:FkbM family methyltransferase
MLNPVSNYIKQLISIHKKVLLWPINWLENRGSNEIAVFIRNIKNRLTDKKHRFGFDKTKMLFYVIESNQIHYFGNRIRGLNLYSHGLTNRAKKLSYSYLLNKIDISKDDIVIDCGANYADLFIWLKEKIKPENYITFEPGNEEFKTIIENAPQSTNNNIGLGNENCIKKFYINKQSADSSFIEPNFYTETAELKTITLSSYINKHGIKKIKLLKLEAEGFEPEILDGAHDIMYLIEYVAIDGGYERGVLREETFSYLTNFLINHGYEMMGINLESGRDLFKRT